MTTMCTKFSARQRPGRWGATAAVLGTLGLAACSSLLDVKNPNNVNLSDLSNPASATAQVNGVQASVARAWGQILTPYSMATDELTWIGSRDAWSALDQGSIYEPTNEFVDAAFFFVGEARWWSDEVIRRVQGFANGSVLADSNALGRVYLYGAIEYTQIANLFDDFPIGSDRRVAAAGVGPANMDSLYNTAINYATQGLTVAQAIGDSVLMLDLTAARATARYYKAAWATLNNPPPASVPVASPLVNDPGAVADANTALVLLDSLVKTLGPDWHYEFTYSPTTFSTDIGFEVNERLEMRIGSTYVYPLCTVSGCSTGGKTVKVDSVRLRDPIDNIPDPELRRFLCGTKACKDPSEGFLGTTRFGPLTIMSARELHLIVAEAALAASDLTGFENAINAERAFDGLSNYTGAGPTPLALLQYERQRNLFLQGKRLIDEYRFGLAADLWAGGSDALTCPGTFLPITISERLANTSYTPPANACAAR